MTKKSTKAAAVLEMLNKGMSSKEIRERFNVSPSYLWKLKQSMAHKVEDDNEVRPRTVAPHKVMRVTKAEAKAFRETAYQITRGRQARITDKVKETIEEWRNEPEIDEVLTERGNRYGNFISHAMITQLLKGTMNTYLTQHNKTLMPDQQEALDMIFHKIGRILNGDPDYVDSWVDIAGYAKLVADRLQGTVR